MLVGNKSPSVQMMSHLVYWQGSLGETDKLISKVTVLANDDPYGVYVISTASRPLRISEQLSGKRTSCTITLEQNDGTGKFLISNLCEDNSFAQPGYDDEEISLVFFCFLSEIPVVVERQPNSGTFGTVEVAYRTLTNVQTLDHLPAAVSRASDTDFVQVNGSVLFHPGILSQQFNITITDDSLPEIDESVFVVLTSANLVEKAQDRQGKCQCQAADHCNV